MLAKTKRRPGEGGGAKALGLGDVRTAPSLPAARDQRAVERAWRQRRRWHAAWLAHQVMPLDRYYATSVPPHVRAEPDLAERLARLEAEVARLRRRLEEVTRERLRPD